MKKNMSNTDKLIRVVIAAILGVLYFLDYIGGTLAYVLMGVAIILLLTSLVNFCPLYRLFGIVLVR
ncbi:MAG: DUF2892 domain-containing protein [Flavobacteriaceae bacterium]|nr:DUF2892 domain-containing protein [Flavobacteriaceae bacterium]